MSESIGYSTLDIIPSARGFAASLNKQVLPEMAAAGEASGKAFSAHMIKNIATAGIGLGALGSLFKAGKTFEDMRDTIRAGSGESGKALDALVEVALKTSEEIPAHFEEIGQAVVDVNTRLDLTGDTLVKFTRSFLEAGRITKAALDMKTVTGALTIFHQTGKLATSGVDTLFQVSQKTGVSINELAGSIKSGAPVLQSFGFSFKDSAALIGVFDKAGLDAGTTIMALKKGLMGFSKAGRDPEVALKATVAQLQALLKAGKDIEANNLSNKVFGSRGATQFLAAIKAGKFSVDNMFDSLKAGSDTVIKAGLETQKFSEKFDILKKNMMTSVKPAADIVFETISEGMSWLNENGVPILKNFSHWLADNSSWLFKTAQVLGTVYAAWKALLIVETVTKAIVGFVTISRSGTVVAELYRAAMTAQMDAQLASAAATTVNSGAVARATALMASETAVAATLAAGVSAATMAEYAQAAATSATTLTLGEYLSATVGATAATESLAASSAAAAAAQSKLSLSSVAAGGSLLRMGLGVVGKMSGIATALGLVALEMKSINEFTKDSTKSFGDWVRVVTLWSAMQKAVRFIGGRPLDGSDGTTTVPVGANGHTVPGQTTPGAAVIAAKSAAAAIAAAKAQAIADALAAKQDAARVKAAAALAAQAATVAKINLQIAITDQKQLLKDFARYIKNDFITEIANSSISASDVIGKMVSGVSSVSSGFAATISDPVKQGNFNLASAKIIQGLNDKLLSFEAPLDAINKARQALEEKIQDAQSSLEAAIQLRGDAAKRISELLETPFGLPSELAAGFSATGVTADTILATYKSIVEMVNERFTEIAGTQKDTLLASLKAQTQQLIDLANTTVKLADGTSVSIEKALQAAQKSFEEAQQASDNYAKKFSSGLRDSAMSLSYFVTQVTLADGRLVAQVASPSALVASFKLRLQALKDFATNLSALTARGLGENLIDQIVALGAESGGALAAQLVTASDAQLATLQQTAEGITSVTDALGNDLATQFYGQATDSAKALRDGYAAQQAGIQAEMSALVTTIDVALSPLTDKLAVLGTDSAQALLTKLKSKDAELLGWAQGIGAKMAQAIADALVALNLVSGGNNFGLDIQAAKAAAAELQAKADAAAAKAAQEKIEADKEAARKSAEETAKAAAAKAAKETAAALANLQAATGIVFNPTQAAADKAAADKAAQDAAAALAALKEIQAAIARQVRDSLAYQRSGVGLVLD